MVTCLLSLLSKAAANRFSRLAPVSWSDDNEVIQEAAAAINTRLLFLLWSSLFSSPCCSSYVLPCFPVTCRAVTGIKAEHLVWTRLYRQRVWFKSVSGSGICWSVTLWIQSMSRLPHFPRHRACNSPKAVTDTNGLQACEAKSRANVWYSTSKQACTASK